MMEAAKNLDAIEGKVNRLPTLSNRFYQVARNLRFRGATGALSHYGGRALQILTGTTESRDAASEEASDERFAAGSYESPLRELAIQSPNAKWGLPYAPTNPDFFETVVANLPINLSEYDFVDLGAGKGLALLLASKFPFKSITGVEYSKVLAETAVENLRSCKEQEGNRRPIDCLWGDAANFEFAPSPTVLYLFNPFQGKVMDRVIANIESSLSTTPRDLWVIYGIPWEGRKFRRSPMLETLEWKADYSLHRSVSR
jgi:hypothetical protein